jgi:hypothetical protein
MNTTMRIPTLCIRRPVNHQSAPSSLLSSSNKATEIGLNLETGSPLLVRMLVRSTPMPLLTHQANPSVPLH